MAVVMASVIALGNIASAGVRGGHYEGVVKYGDGSTYPIAVDFAASGTQFREDGYLGSYTEVNLVVISFWNAEFDDFTNYTAKGISILGFLTTYNVNQTDGADDYSGTLLKMGPSQVRTAK